MQSLHDISANGRMLKIDELYFRTDEIQFVDIVQQERPTLLRLMLVNAVFCLLIALICTAFSPGAACVFALWAVMEIVIVAAVKPRHALRIGQRFGTTKAIISEDRKALEEIRRQIMEIMAQQA